MKRIFTFVFALSMCLGQMLAQSDGAVFLETFRNVAGNAAGTAELVTSQLDHPDGWTFDNVYAGEQCIVVRKGGSVTLPAVPELIGNVECVIGMEPWGEWDGSTEEDHVLTITNGELSSSTYSERVAMSYLYAYGLGPDSRLTLTVSHDVKITRLGYAYGGVMKFDDNQPVTYSHPSGEYFSPIDVTLTSQGSNYCYYDDASRYIMVYTTDGTEPTRHSTRYTGAPVHVASNTTIRAGLIVANGGMMLSPAQTYTFPVQENSERPENTCDVTVAPGELKDKLVDLDVDVIESLALHGRINGEDLAYLCAAEGRVAELIYIDLSDVTFDYDGTPYKVRVVAPEAGMGTVYTYQYIFSADNYDESVPTGRPGSYRYNCYRNDLSALFYKNSKIKTVVWPKCLQEVGESAFAYCGSLKNVILHDGVTVIGKSAFSGSPVEFYDFPKSVEKIGASAFADTRLGAIRFDKKVEIGEGAFAWSTLQELDLPYPTDSIAPAAFVNTNLKRISIGEGVKYIGANAFASCPIAEAQLPSSIREIGGGCFSNCPFLGGIEPIDGVRYIGKVAYEVTDQSRTAYNVKDGTVMLGDDLFQYVSAGDYTLPASVEIIGESAFASSGIKSLPNLPNLKRIHADAFYACEKLGRVIIPESVEYISPSAFSNCDALWNMTYNAIDADTEYGLNMRSVEKVTLGDRVRRLPQGLFTNNTDLTELVLPQSVEIIEERAFEGCTNLAYIGLGDNIHTIKGYAFSGCAALKDIHWPLGLKYVGEWAFSRCASLEVASFPEGVTTVEYGALNECKGLKTLYLASTIEDMHQYWLSNIVPDAPITVTCASETPLDCARECTLRYVKQVRVPATAVDAYRQHPSWANLASCIAPIGEISPAVENKNTTFKDNVADDADLTDAVVGDVYVTIDKLDAFDRTDGSIILFSAHTTDETAAIGGMAPGKSDLANRFNGLVTMVSSGYGVINIDCLTIGSRQISVKIGEDEPRTFTQPNKGNVTVNYNVPADTYVYVYATDNAAAQPSARQSRAAAQDVTDYVKIYAIGVDVEYTGIEEMEADKDGRAAVTGIYTIDGVRVASPSAPGIYIVRRADGTASKILVR